jgi:hypothetical protein
MAVVLEEVEEVPVQHGVLGTHGVVMVVSQGEEEMGQWMVVLDPMHGAIMPLRMVRVLHKLRERKMEME